MTDIPFYNDIYAFPGPDRCHHHPQKPHFTRSQVIETSKEVIINDAVGHTRYAIRLVSEMQEDGHLGFQVQVVHYYPSDSEEDNDLLMTIPEEGYESDYAKIEKAFDTCVQRYDSLVKSETQDFRDIDIYKDKIGYEKVEPECCMFCRWSRRMYGMHDEHCYSKDCTKLECHNPKNEKDFTYTVEFPRFLNRNAHRYCHDGWQKLPWMKENPFKRIPLREDEILNRIFPRVDPFGKCKNFEKLLKDGGKEETSEEVQNPIVPNDESLDNVGDNLAKELTKEVDTKDSN